MLLALLLAAAAPAQDAGKPPAEDDDDVLGWLSGTQEQEPPPQPEPPAEPPAAPPAEPQDQGDDVLGWLSGPQDADAAPEPEAPPAAAPQPRPAGAAPRAAAAADFAEKLRKAMTLELQVQQYETNAMGAEANPDTFQGFKKARWDRMQQDKVTFRETAGQMSLQPLEPPPPDEGVTLSRDAQAVFAALGNALEATRATRQLDQYIDFNRAFVNSADWGQRDHAVELRDEIVAREVTFAHLVQDAHTVATGAGDDELLASMRTRLQQVAPEVESAGDDRAVLVVHDEALRGQVLAEVDTVLAEQAPPAPPPRPDAELRPRVEELRQQLLDKAGLPPILEEHATLAKQIADLDKQLTADLPQDKRLELVGQRTPLIMRSNDLEVQWLGSVPDPPTWDELIPTTQELIHRRMLDLGPAGVLYGVRCDALDTVLADGLPDTPSQWKYFDQQQDFLTLLDGLQPSSGNPLHNVSLPDLWGMALLAEAQQKVANEKALVAQSTPKPSAKKQTTSSFGVKGKSNSKSQSKPKPKPKPKPMPHKKKGKGKKPY